MLTVWKYELDTGLNRIDVPVGSKPLSVGTKFPDYEINIWINVETENPKVPMLFYVIGTGWEIPQSLMVTAFVGTVIFANGYVWHVFEVIELTGDPNDKVSEQPQG